MPWRLEKKVRLVSAARGEPTCGTLAKRERSCHMGVLVTTQMASVTNFILFRDPKA